MDDERVAAEAGIGNRHMSRRTVLRAAGHAAWVVPAIQVVSMAPAFAAASDQLQITAASGQWTLGSSDYVTGSVTVQNSSTTDTTVALQLTLTFPNFYVYQQITIFGLTLNIPLNLTFSNVSTGWGTPTATYSGTGTSRIATVVFTRTGTQLAASAATTLNFRATTQKNVTTASGADTIQVVATASNGFSPGAGVINPT